MTGSDLARRMWQALETVHMTVYFAAEPRDAYRRAGLRGGWMGYFASPERVLFLRQYRGWSEDDWAAATARLQARGWVEAGGSLTGAGRAARDALEARTDDLAMAPWDQLGPAGCARLLELLDEPVRLIVAGDGVPFPNPVGLPPPPGTGMR